LDHQNLGDRFLITPIFLILVFLLLPSFASADGEQKIAIIANASFPLRELTLPDLKEIYLGNKKFVRWTRLYPIHQQKDRVIKNLFIENALGLSPISYMGYWHIKSFRDGSPPPNAFQSSGEVIESVKANPGGLGYIWANETHKIDGIRVLITLDVQVGFFP